ncbi:MAG: lipase family protein [Myxococcales bacterium]|nr:lipase family protein [Myxococcales bacterium]
MRNLSISLIFAVSALFLMPSPTVQAESIFKKAWNKTKSTAKKGVKAVKKKIDEVKRKQELKSIPKFKKGALRSFHYQSSAFRWENAYLMSIISSLTYRSSSIGGEAFEDLGFADADYMKKKNIDVYVAKSPKFIVIAFRGTEFSDPRDIVADSNAKKTPAYGGYVHTGFHRAYKQIRDAIAQKAKKESKGGRLPIFLTGHSLGGALAILAAAHLRDLKLTVRAVYTYGQPRVGDKEFNAKLTTSIYRIANEHDPVSPVPASLTKQSRYYGHVGKLYYFNSKGHYKASMKKIPNKNFKSILKIFTSLGKGHKIATYIAELYKQLPSKFRNSWPKP